MNSDTTINPVERVAKAFEQEFGRFEHLRSDSSAVHALALGDAETLAREIVDVRARHTGKKSELAGLKKQIGRVAPEERAQFAQSVQQLEAHITDATAQVETVLRESVRVWQIERERIDVTLPGRRVRHGHLHPITLLRQKIEDLFVAMGYAVEDGPEIETDFYNFDALNIPANHPARSSQDTLYTTNGFALRSQTSTVQIRAMQRRRPPLRVIAPGKVFRRDTPDATHNPMFYQVEGLLVDRKVTLADLKGTLETFVRGMFGANTKTRFRPSYFPFTEPSAEVDYTCFKCDGAGCRLCKGSGWIELGGSGMVHPNVLKSVDVDPQEFSGFAFGLGIDRQTALMYGLDDIRLLYENDTRFLEQFK